MAFWATSCLVGRERMRRYALRAVSLASRTSHTRTSMVNLDGGEQERWETYEEDSEARERDANAWPRREEAAVVYKEARVRGQCDLLSIISTWRQMSVMQESNIMQGM